MDNFLEIHNSGRAVSVRKPFRVRNFNLQTLNAFQADDVARQGVEGMVYSEYILCMPVHFSPVLAVMVHDPKQVWKPRYTNSVRSLYDLMMIWQCFWNNPHMDHVRQDMKRVAAINDKLRQDRADKRAALFESMEAIDEALKTQQIQRFESVDRAARCLEAYTLEQIHLVEQALIDLFKMRNVPLTSRELLTAAVIGSPEGQKAFFVTLKRMLDAKQVLLNRQMVNGEHEERQWFGLDQLEARMTQPDNLFKGYIDAETIWEYFRLIVE